MLPVFLIVVGIIGGFCFYSKMHLAEKGEDLYVQNARRRKDTHGIGVTSVTVKVMQNARDVEQNTNDM